MARSRYKSLVDTFAADIHSGRLLPGTRLPTHRQLAVSEGLALVTASRVYAELEAMGLVSGETGRGTFVRETSLPPSHGIDQPDVAAGVIDLNFNYPSLQGQGDLLRNALRQLALSGDLESHLRYQPHAGRAHERASIARHLRSRGLTVEAEQVLIVSGAQHGLAVTLMAQVADSVLAQLQPLLPDLSPEELHTRMRFIGGAALGPPPRSRLSLDQDDPKMGDAALDALVRVARAGLTGDAASAPPQMIEAAQAWH